MCFSAGASFGAGAVLSVVGVASIKKVRTPSQIPFASIPLFFSAQQITEGFLWLSLTHPGFSPIQSLTTNLFIFFAQVLWPFWVPYSIYKFHEEVNYKKTQKLLIAVGLLVSVCLGYCLLFYNIDAKIIGHHISYKQDYPLTLKWLGGFLYIIATIAPLFISSIKKMQLLGATIFASYIFTTIFYKNYTISIWCFFAAVISIFVFFIVSENNTIQNQVNQSSVPEESS